MDTAQIIVALLGAGGGGAALTALFTGVTKWLSGSTHREQLRNTSLSAQRTSAIESRDEAERERDEADGKRREAEEHVAILKRQLILLGVTPLERTNNQTQE